MNIRPPPPSELHSSASGQSISAYLLPKGELKAALIKLSPENTDTALTEFSPHEVITRKNGREKSIDFITYFCQRNIIQYTDL